LSDGLIAPNFLRTVQVAAVRTVSPTVKTLWFKDRMCAKARPGQFLMIWIPGVDEIPFSVLSASKDGLVSVALKKVGEATEALQEKTAGALIGVRGPFGNSFTMKGRRLLIVGGGTGAAPLLLLTRRMIAKDAKTVFILGAKTKKELLFMDEMRRLPEDKFELVTSTEDGTCGITGLCTEPVDRILAAQKFDMVYCCGPEKMIAKVFELTETHCIGFEASLERLMRCAIGLCGSCVIGKYRVCKDGPVFTSNQLREVRNEFGVTKRDRYGRKIPID
jgi:dihydroorotate dehydrogenase electron transfer subunit